MKFTYLLVATLGFGSLFSNTAEAQNALTPTETHVKKELLAGPFVSYIDNYSTRVWMMVPKGTEKVKLHFEDFEEARAFDVSYKVGRKGDFQKNRWDRVTSAYLLGDKVPVIVDVQNLQKDKEYNVSIFLDDDLVAEDFTVYMARAHKDDVFFLFGGNLDADEKDFSIFDKMEKTPNDFMLWGGGNFGTPESYSFKGLNKQFKQVRSIPQINEFMKSTPQIATWGSEDYSDQDLGKAYTKKDSAIMAFNLFWPNIPRKVYNFTHAEYGTYGKYDYEDVDVFVLDELMFRDSKNKTTKYGEKQMQRLMRDLWSSNASFKIIVSNSTFFGESDESLKSFESDYNEFITRFHKGNFSGLVFLSMNENGTSEFITEERENDYPLTEMSVGGLENGQYSRVRVEGDYVKNTRKIILEIFNADGKVIDSKEILASEMKN
ncbi:MAG: hypothetical protein ACPG6V_01925 [Flavobacteriales bacterium]